MVNSINRLITHQSRASCNNLSGQITVCAEHSPGGRIHCQRTFSFSGTYRSLQDQPKTSNIDKCYFTSVCAANIGEKENNKEINEFTGCVTARCRHWQHNYATCSRQQLITRQKEIIAQQTCSCFLFVFVAIATQTIHVTPAHLIYGAATFSKEHSYYFQLLHLYMLLQYRSYSYAWLRM